MQKVVLDVLIHGCVVKLWSTVLGCCIGQHDMLVDVLDEEDKNRAR
jgi:hypothetical protein